ncbi:MAG: hypothetical protein RL715_610 [Chloroflexota bacterium]|jgi:hypothetical protein
MRRSAALSALVAALAVAAAVLALQALSALVPPLGSAIRQLPLIPVALICATLLISIRMIRSR